MGRKSTYEESEERVKELEKEVLEHRLAEEAIGSDLEEPRQRNAEIRSLLESTRKVLEYHEFEASARDLFLFDGRLPWATPYS